MTAATEYSTAQVDTAAGKPHLDHPLDIRAALIFLAILAGGLFYMAYSIYGDVARSGGGPTTIVPFLLLGVALLIALGFEFVNGFHDTANAVATVIYTHSLPANVAVVWSGMCNLIGVLLSSGAVAFGIVSLLPVELILQVGSSAGFAMVFALLIAAIIWNLGTWWFGLPASSSHTLIGSIIGVGVANALMRGRDGTAGVDWDQVTKIGKALLLSPVFGFVLSAAAAARDEGGGARPRALQGAEGRRSRRRCGSAACSILTCTLRVVLPRLERRAEGHGPHHADPDRRRADGLCAQPRACRRAMRKPSSPPRQSASKIVEAHGAGYSVIGDPRPAVTDYVHAHQITEGTYPSLAVLVKQIGDQVKNYGSLAKTPLDKVAKRPQRHVSRLRGAARARQGQGERADGRREETARRLQEAARPRRPSSFRSG